MNWLKQALDRRRTKTRGAMRKQIRALEDKLQETRRERNLHRRGETKALQQVEALRQVGGSDPLEFFERLRLVHFGPSYSEVDRYQDFRKVFLDTTEGRRVLYQLFDWGHVFHTNMVPGASVDSHLAFFRDGERSIVLQILAVLDTAGEEPPATDVQLNEEQQDAS